MTTPTYFANAVERVERDPAGGPWRAYVLCGCGCMGEGILNSHVLARIMEVYGDELRGALLTFEGHGPGVHTGRGVLWLAPAPPVVLYVDTDAINARDLVAVANAALRGMAGGRANS